ncbi:MAG: LacI family DNA-binding transcriptional regulator [Defluviitaleaceae bacterium]|nr:LacI family DNA-binding transcriptional regulator [Defluviitaleaceae bacterium]
MSNKITIYDVARKADVSLATVSRVLNNPTRVKEKTRNRVLEVIKELGYRPNAIARGLASRRSTNIGLIVPTLSRASISEMTNGIADIADKYRYSVFLNVTHNERELQTDSWENMIASQVDGVLLASDQMGEDQMDRLLNETVPTVLLGFKDSQSRVPAVLIDYASAAYEATKKLIDSGNKDIAFLTVEEKFETNPEKEAGYIKAVEEAGLTPRVLKFADKFETSIGEFKHFFEHEKAPDAALAIRDSMAIGFMNAAIDSGLSVPDDIEIVGFQNTQYALMSRPQLSTVMVPTYDIGAVSMRLLTKLMNKEEEEVEEQEVMLPHAFAWRGSTKN